MSVRCRDPDGFWAEQAKRLAWITPPTKIKNTSFHAAVSIKWFEDGVLNASVTCLDRHLADARRPDRDHLGGRRPERRRKVTYRELHERSAASPTSCKALGVKKGDRVTIYLPMIVEAAVRDARLRPDRRDPFHRLRRLLAGQPRQPHPGLRSQGR